MQSTHYQTAKMYDFFTQSIEKIESKLSFKNQPKDI
jgi:hypothetical protein